MLSATFGSIFAAEPNPETAADKLIIAIIAAGAAILGVVTTQLVGVLLHFLKIRAETRTDAA